MVGVVGRGGVRFLLIATFCSLIWLTGCPGSFHNLLGEPPEQDMIWPDKRGSGEFGASGDFIFYGHQCDPPELEVWRWSDDTIKKRYSVQFDRDISSAALGPANMWTCELFDKQQGAEICIGDLKSGKIIARRKLLFQDANVWKSTGDGGAHLGRSSRNGKYVGVWDDQSFEKHIVRFGLVAPDGKSFNWIVDLHPEHYSAKFSYPVVPSDNGAFIGVGGWENGIAVIDVAKKRVLWTLKPELDADINDIAFSPDIKFVYAGGVRGLVYGVKLETGEIVSKWWATLSKKEEYGHYIDTISVSPDGKFVAAGTIPDGLAWLFSAKDGHRRIFEHGGKGVYMTAFSPDSKRLASYGAGKIKIWKLPEETTKPTPSR